MIYGPESVFPLGSIAGSGHNSSSAWDYVHVSSVQKGEDGHYLLSGRHASTLYKVDGKDGSILWRLGGLKSNFTLDTEEAAFAWQHHARYIPGDTSAISLLDNSAGTGSTGKIIQLDLHNGSASLRQVFEPPHHIFAVSQGSVQILPNGNVLVNWGSAGQVTEYSANGTLIFHAFLDSGTRQLGTQNYRAFRGNWTGYSSETPAVVAEQDRDGSTNVWVSWNGDTRTAYWRFKWNRLPVSGNSLDALGSLKVPRGGFETMATLPEGGQYKDISLEAVDENGNVLTRIEAIRVNQKLDFSQDVSGQHSPGGFKDNNINNHWMDL